ncbi:peptidoglycan-binding protein [Streptomyces aquilus]|uniref:Peptidoglycan-binding protein n=1 Tax=Streptomyces aquilus TaxID=2548456 RepID=A0A3Q9C2F6_9ACTN|nr:peptidoglycan-binding protein [Streptomyces aquilus]AZP22688.1 peptidoglycan-binding protein [Streptomyces aquilus]
MALQLVSARFRGDPILERIRAADTTAYLKSGQSGEHIKAVQFALIDLGNPDYAIPSGATGFFGAETANAVKNFKQDEGLVPSDPVVGVGTITRLDGKWALPNADRDEWLSWTTRLIPEFNFTRKNEMTRLSLGQTFTFNPVCGAIPTKFKDAITGALAELLDYEGSPDGKYSPSASWGASPLDFYHFHVDVDLTPTGYHPSWAGSGSTKDKAGKFFDHAEQLKAKANLVAPQGSPAWTVKYRNLLLAPTSGSSPGMVDQYIDLIKTALANSVAINQPLRLIWHSFEAPIWRPVSMYSTDLRRHWLSSLLQTPSTPLTHPAFVPTSDGYKQHYFELFEPHFLVDQNRVITLFGPTMIETAALANLNMQRIWDAWPPDPVLLKSGAERA